MKNGSELRSATYVNENCIDSFVELSARIGTPMIIMIAIAVVAVLTIIITLIACCFCSGDSREVKELKIRYSSLGKANSVNVFSG